MEEKGKIHYSAEDIRKYLDGRLSGPEMQAIEKAALEDPFLADAIEGLEEARKHSVSFESGMTDLQSRLSKRIRQDERKRGLLLPVNWKAIASVVFILGLTAFAYMYFINKKPAELSNTTKKDSNREIPSVSSNKERIDTNAIIPIQDSARHLPSEISGNRKTIDKNKKKVSQFEKTQPVPADFNSSEKKQAELPADNFSKAGVDSASGVTAAAAPVQNNDQSVLHRRSVQMQPNDKLSEVAIKQDKAISDNLIKGIVVDEKGKPIPFAPVKFNGSEKGTFTDTSGFFKLNLKNPRSAALVFIHPPGYEPVSAELNTDSAVINRIQMQPTVNALNGETTPRYSTMVTGWEAFIDYITSNKKVTKADSAFKGEEIISFLVHPNGKITSFKIEKSVSPAHDEEILRLIRSGPALKTENGEKLRCRVSVLFQ